MDFILVSGLEMTVSRCEIIISRFAIIISHLEINFTTPYGTNPPTASTIPHNSTINPHATSRRGVITPMTLPCPTAIGMAVSWLSPPSAPPTTPTVLAKPCGEGVKMGAAAIKSGTNTINRAPTALIMYINNTYKMIEYIKGELTELTPATAVVEAAGVGYALNISLNTYSTIQGKKEVKLYVHENLVTGGRDDAYTLYGFASRQERDLYRLLITVSGVGANTARMILSASSPSELCNAIASADERMLKAVKGIGLKTAQRIIVDLKDKIVQMGIATELHASTSTAPSIDMGVRDEAVSALTMLGFAPAPSAKIVAAILQDEPTMPVEQVVKLALKQIK